ncbi:MAG: phosphate acetyltransferase [Prevotella sp.]|nr:phosphate acetyltransferase [Prevotella sp.]
MDLIHSILERAKSNKQRIVLPEATEERTLRAANMALGDEIADIILIGNPEEISRLADQWGLTHIEKATIIDPENNPHSEEYANLLYELRKNKGMTPEQAKELVKNPLYLGCMIIKTERADGQISGALSTTAETLRPALQIIKCKPGINCVSGAMLLLSNQRQYGEDGIMVLGDVAVTPMPTPDQLAQIAECTAETARSVAMFKEPRVAMLSFSTKGSAAHEEVDKVVEATRLAQERCPELKIDGELQADAAIVPSIGKSKAPGSDIAGKANVLIFPSLSVGNISYKLAQRLGNAVAIGPILQGIARPVNDLSRGCSIEDIYYLVAITACQAMDIKK